MKYRTLIIFDTNCLRRVSKKRINYSDFGFGGNYRQLKEFIKRNNLYDLIKVVVPRTVIDELAMQARRDYISDIEDVNDIQNRLGKFGKISIHQASGFDIESEVDKAIKEFIESDKEASIVEMKDGHDVLDYLRRRAFINKLPFRSDGNAGFKDALLWENILHADIYEEYDRVYFLTDNGKDFIGCEKEFLKKHGKEFGIVSYEQIEVLLGNIYKEEIDNAPVLALVRSEYFETYLKENLQGMMIFETDHTGKPIENRILNVDIVDVLYDLKERDEIDDDGDKVSFQDVTSAVNVFFDNGDLKEYFVKSVIGAENQLLEVELLK